MEPQPRVFAGRVCRVSIWVPVLAGLGVERKLVEERGLTLIECSGGQPPNLRDTKAPRWSF